jgi:uridine kinase
MSRKKAVGIKKILKRDGSVVAYKRDRIKEAILQASASAGKPPHAGFASDMATRVELALIETYKASAVPTVEEIQDVVESVLMVNGHTKIARNYIIYRHERAMARSARAYAFEVSDSVPYRKIYEVLRWNLDHQCDSVQNLNALIKGGGMPELIKACEARYGDEIKLTAGKLMDRMDSTGVVIVAGPSSSGKTTTMIKISEALKKAKLGFTAINIDHYYFDLEQHPKDEFGDYDYETPQALDLDLINEHLVMLLDGKTVKTPHYDFKTGKRTLGVHEMKLKKNELLLIDSLHGLYEGMTSSVPADSKFKVYIETLGQFQSTDGNLLRWADNRLLRRMIRDKHHRNLLPMQTLTHWHYVRRSEIMNIIPFIDSADSIVNSALPYELPFLKHRLFRYISAAKRKYENDPSRLDASIRASRVYDLLKPLKACADDSCIPSNSLIREFLGGSKYRY